MEDAPRCPRPWPCEICRRRPRTFLYHHIRAQQSQNAKNMSSSFLPLGHWRCQCSFLFPLHIWYSYIKTFKTQNLCIYKLVHVFERCMGDGLNQTTPNNEYWIVFFKGNNRERSRSIKNAFLHKFLKQAICCISKWALRSNLHFMELLRILNWYDWGHQN